MVQLNISDSVYAYSRGEVIVMFNNAATANALECDAPPGLWHDELGAIPDTNGANGKLRVNIPPRSSAILIRR